MWEEDDQAICGETKEPPTGIEQWPGTGRQEERQLRTCHDGCSFDYI